jgi:L-aspartate oxidase
LPGCSHRASGAGGAGTLFATGGYAALWERTTNSPGSTGEGIALAYRAGAAVADLELVQFHPTALLGSGLLLSEALRGEGALPHPDRRQPESGRLLDRGNLARPAERFTARRFLAPPVGLARNDVDRGLAGSTAAAHAPRSGPQNRRLVNRPELEGSNTTTSTDTN